MFLDVNYYMKHDDRDSILCFTDDGVFRWRRGTGWVPDRLGVGADINYGKNNDWWFVSQEEALATIERIEGHRVEEPRVLKVETA